MLANKIKAHLANWSYFESAYTGADHFTFPNFDRISCAWFSKRLLLSEGSDLMLPKAISSALAQRVRQSCLWVKRSLLISLRKEEVTQ